ncbi:hypothetical protein A2Z00_00365 [Candidatus Gottesmanbacteria bacterium RBG_13_45_10]|uniref:Coenzyme A biosynthesis bifunctional protein CoaBC n=1 Tax=Candidatus Gottesmanbacteria bacterium RBG_13_45_10 TaxID=1798370 RepID=A0A1F5ZFV8_9BACT|nr:MAG: hypothetical protein A2Z00_00365 [Candidatus Gottesmanbacteria bacterium RBG_13_45_10]
MKKTIVVGVTGGIAAYKTCELVQRLVHRGIRVIVIMTKAATSIVDPSQFEKITHEKVRIELFEDEFHYKTILAKRKVDHITLAQSADLFIIVPATANVIAKIAAGFADDYLTTAVLAATCPIAVCPSMNTAMWASPVTQKNISTLRSLGISIFGPDAGILACGTKGEGRLKDIATIEKEVIRMLDTSLSLSGKRILITAGATQEKIDDIRYITNKSSGKMGAALAESCYLRGADVILLRSRTSVSPRYQCKEYMFDTAEDLEHLMKHHVKTVDLCFHAAAVSDFAVARTVHGKISSDKRLPLELTPRTKILTKIKTWNPHVYLVGFKAEWNLSKEQLIVAAKEKLQITRADMIVANDVGKSDRGFSADANEVVCVNKKGGSLHIPFAPKRIIADKIMDYIQENLLSP